MILDIAVVVLGIAFVALGFVAAAKEVFARPWGQKEAVGGAADPGEWAKLVRAATELIKVAPLWLLLVLVGLALIGLGSHGF